MLSEAWNAATEEFSVDWPSTTVYQIQGARIILSVSCNQKDWGAMQEWIAYFQADSFLSLAMTMFSFNKNRMLYMA